MFKSRKLAVILIAFMGVHNLQAQNIEGQIDALIKRMTLPEKVAMLHANSSFTSGGVPRLGIPEIVMSDGPHGVRPEHGRDWVRDEGLEDAGTYLPTGIGLAATWNRSLGHEYGKVLGSEANYRGKDIILGPGVNIIRSPLNGRNFEYLSEDPYLTAQMAIGYIKGVQSEGVSACVKHYAANNEEADRGSVDVRMSERALREIYLPAFEAAVKDANVNAVMGAYNKFRGQHTTHHKYLINDILKGEWGFKGLLMSDWGSVHDTKEALENGTDLEMGTDLMLMYSSVSQTEAGNEKTNASIYDQFFLADSALRLVKSGAISESVVDEKVRRILRMMFKTKMIGDKRAPGAYNSKAHQQTALKVAEESIVLLKNQKNILPLNKQNIRSIAVIGENATRENAMGGGSSQVKAFYEITPLQGLKNLLDKQVAVNYARGYKIEKGNTADAQLIKEAAEAASKADAAVIFCGWTHGYDYNKWSDNAYDAEGVDKPNMNLPFGQDQLIEAVLKANPKTIIVLMGGGPVDMSAWADDAQGIIEGWYPGMEGGNALAKVIFGEVNPSGKLPMTFPVKLEDSPAHQLGDFPGKNGVANYNEDIYVGYRYFDTYKVTPRFAFGHGLSYTSFSYRDLKVNASGKQVEVSLSIKNTGGLDGSEIIQLYVHDEQSEVKRPEKELKGFVKVFLKAGEEQVVKMVLPPSAFKYFDEQTAQWKLEKGKFMIMAGASSRDIRLQENVDL